MAEIAIEVNVEYATIKLFGVWFTVAEINDFISHLEETMQDRNWRKP